jgi:DNA-binding NtrC family response regulator
MDAEEAFELLGREDFNLLIVDISASTGTGLSFCQAASRAFPNVVVLVLAAAAAIEQTVAALQHGAFDYLTKPLRRATLIWAVERALAYQALVVAKDLALPSLGRLAS